MNSASVFDMNSVARISASAFPVSSDRDGSCAAAKKTFMKAMLLDAFYERPLNIYAIGSFSLKPGQSGMHIPDMVEFHLLDRILDDTTHPLHHTATQAYQHNLDLWTAYNNEAADIIPGFVYPPVGVMRALAAYSTLHECPEYSDYLSSASSTASPVARDHAPTTRNPIG